MSTPLFFWIAYLQSEIAEQVLQAFLVHFLSLKQEVRVPGSFNCYYHPGPLTRAKWRG